MSDVVSVTLNDTAITAFAKKIANLKKDITVVTSVANATKKYAKQSVAAAQTQVKNEMKLASTLKQRTQATTGQINSIKRLTSTQQANGVVSDEVQMAGAEQLATYASNTSSIKTLIPAMNNLLVKQKGLNGSTSDAVAIADLMGKGLNGQTDELEKAGISFSDAQKQVLQFGSEEEKAAVLAKAVNDKVGNANKEMANTDVGAIQEANNLFLDLKEQIGKMLLPCLGKLARWFSTIYKTMMKYKKITIIIGAFIATFAGVATVISTIIGILETLTAVQALFNFTLLGCPIILIVAAIALVIAAIVAMIVYWDQIKAALASAWESISAFFGNLIEVAANVWQSITAYFGNLRDSVIGVFSDMVSGIKEHWDRIIEFLKNPAKGIAEFIEEHTTNKKENTEAGNQQNGTNKNTNPIIKGKALGTSYWKGGLTYINERGGEIVDLPNGSRVIPADKSDRILSGNGISFGNVYITAKGVTARQVVNEIVPQLKLQLANM